MAIKEDINTADDSAAAKFFRRCKGRRCANPVPTAEGRMVGLQGTDYVIHQTF